MQVDVKTFYPSGSGCVHQPASFDYRRSYSYDSSYYPSTGGTVDTGSVSDSTYDGAGYTLSGYGSGGTEYVSTTHKPC